MWFQRSQLHEVHNERNHNFTTIVHNRRQRIFSNALQHHNPGEEREQHLGLEVPLHCDGVFFSWFWEPAGEGC